MELIGKQIAIETILGQPPELHYPSWYAAQIEKLPPAPPEYLAEQAGILVTDTDTISRQAAIDALRKMQTYKLFSGDDMLLIDQAWAQTELMMLPPAQPERIKGHWIEIALSNHTYKCSVCGRLLVNITDGKNTVAKNYPYCHCGADMRGEQDERDS